MVLAKLRNEKYWKFNKFEESEQNLSDYVYVLNVRNIIKYRKELKGTINEV